VLAPWPIAAAVIIEFANSESAIKVFMLALLLTLSSPVLTHATGLTFYQHRRTDSDR
jgi:multisubunit Na+/H+ antiporter MnhG subunit